MRSVGVRWRAVVVTAAVVVGSVSLVQPVLAAPAANVPDSAPDEAAATAYARAGDKPVEVSSETTETSRTVANPDGSWTATQYVHPVRVKQGAGWVPIDTTLVRRPDGSIGPKAVTVDVSINPGGSGSAAKPVVEAGEADTVVGLKWTSDLPAPTLAGDTAT